MVNLLLSRNFCQKCVRENSHNFHTVTLFGNLLSHFFTKKFVKSTFLQYVIEFELLNGWFDEIMRKTSKFFWFYFRFHEKFRQTETLFVLLRIGWKLKFILQQRSWYWNCLLIIKHSVWRNYFKNTFCNLKWLLKIRTRYFK